MVEKCLKIIWNVVHEWNPMINLGANFNSISGKSLQYRSKMRGVYCLVTAIISEISPCNAQLRACDRHQLFVLCFWTWQYVIQQFFHRIYSVDRSKSLKGKLRANFVAWLLIFTYAGTKAPTASIFGDLSTSFFGRAGLNVVCCFYAFYSYSWSKSNGHFYFHPQPVGLFDLFFVSMVSGFIFSFWGRFFGSGTWSLRVWKYARWVCVNVYSIYWICMCMRMLNGRSYINLHKIGQCTWWFR